MSDNGATASGGLTLEQRQMIVGRLEKLTGGFRKNAVLMFLVTACFFVAIFVPYVELSFQRQRALARLHTEIQHEAERLRTLSSDRQKQIEELQLKIKTQEQDRLDYDLELERTARYAAATGVASELQAAVKRDFSTPLEVLLVGELPEDIGTSVPLGKAPWRISGEAGGAPVSSNANGLTRHYRVMQSLRARVAEHQRFLQQRVLEPLRQQSADEEQLALVQRIRGLQSKLSAMEERLRTRFSETSATGGSAQLWMPFSEVADDRRFQVILTFDFRQELSDDVKAILADLDNLVEVTPWRQRLQETADKLKLPRPQQQIKSELQQTLNSFQWEQVPLLLKPVRPGLQQLIDHLDVSPEAARTASRQVEPWKKLCGTSSPELRQMLETIQTVLDSAAPSFEMLLDRNRAELKRRRERTEGQITELHTTVERDQAAGRASIQQKSEAWTQIERMTSATQGELEARLSSVGKLVGGVSINLRAAILVFPLLLGGGFLMCCAQYVEIVKLRQALDRSSESSGPRTEAQVDYASLMAPFPLADAERRPLRYAACGFPLLLQVAAVVTVLVTPRSDGGVLDDLRNSVQQVNRVRDDAAAGTTIPKLEDSLRQIVDSITRTPSTTGGPAVGVENPAADDGQPQVPGATASEGQAPAQSPPWLYVLAFAIGLSGMIWGLAYARSATAK